MAGRRERRSRPGSDMPNIPMSPVKQKTLGVRPSCFIWSHLHGIYSPEQQTDFPGQKQNSPAGICSLKVVSIGNAVSTL